jgi:hypothetical protein
MYYIVMKALSFMIRLTVFVALIIGAISLGGILMEPPTPTPYSFNDLAWITLLMG